MAVVYKILDIVEKVAVKECVGDSVHVLNDK
uniref:Uncharacterized protein n=1 Tax=Arundo donax TaxID=35708 RepID=A0A0A8YBD2_ARUDO